MRKDTSVKYVAKYYHSDGNGIHLAIGKTYIVEYNSNVCEIKILEEYRHFYLVRLKDSYNFTINKYHDDLKVIKRLD